MPSRKIHYLLLSVVAVLLILLLTIWSTRTQLAEIAMKSAMQNAGLKDVITDIEDLTFDQSKIAHLQFTLITETGKLSIEADDITIRYTTEQIRQAQIDSLVIANLALFYESKDERMSDASAIDTNTKQPALEPVKLIASIRQALREYIFFSSVSLQRVTLNDEFGVLQDKSFQVKSSKQNGSLLAEITLLDQLTSESPKNLPQLLISSQSNETIAVELHLTDTQGTLPAELALNIHDRKITGNYRINVRNLQSWLTPFVKIDQVDIVRDIDGTLSVDFDNENQILSTLTLNTEKLVYDTTLADDVAIKIRLNNAADKLTKRTELLDGSYIKTGRINSDKFSLEDSQINLTGALITDVDSWHYDGELSWKSIIAAFDKQTIHFKDFAAHITAAPTHLNIDGDLASATVPGTFAFDLEHKLDTGIGNVSIKPLTPLDLDAEANSLSQLVTPWTLPFDLLSGKIYLSSKAAWSKQKALRLDTSIRLEEIGGHVGEQVFSGLSFNHEISVLPKLRSVRSTKLTLKHLDSGVTVNNISTRLAMLTTKTGPLPSIVIQGLRGELLGGTFTGDDLVYNLNKTKNSIKINADNIDLAEIVKTQQLNDIIATGRISGSIPVEITESGVTIENGAFLNDVQNGTIRYNPAAGTEQLRQNPITGIALDALKDFHYSHLSADVNFTPQGSLSIDLHLKGTSPELDTNRPVHLNINTEQDLLSLLKSLRYAQGISESIDNRVRRQYEKKQN